LSNSKCIKYSKELGRARHDPELYKGSPWANHWRDDLLDLGTEGHHVIKKINESRESYLQHRIWALGDISLMEEPFIVAFSGRNWKCPKEEKELGNQIIVRMSEMGLMPIHGNDKGTERAAQRKLREAHGKQILVPHYGLVQFKNKFRNRMAYSVEHGHVLVLSPFNVYDVWQANNMYKRNIFIADLADAMIGVQLTDENAGGDLARRMLRMGKPVYLTEAEGRAEYCVQDHQLLMGEGAEEFKMSQLDFIIRKIKESLGYK